MVVDDDQDTVAILARHLQREGFVPIEANSGAQCLKLVHENEVDVILLDLMMPEMDGYEFRSRQLRSPALCEIPVVVVTGSGEDCVSTVDLRGAPVAHKPVNADNLLAIIERYRSR
jgi:two-component system, chemotaxis family, chemotaxis protein CheY